MKILVTFALENEFAPWRDSAGFERAAASQAGKIYETEIEGAAVRAVLTGAGSKAAERAANEIFNDVADVCVVSGLAGALKASYRVGDILAGRMTARADGPGGIESDAALVEAAADLGARIAGRVVTSERVVATAAEKSRLANMGADAVDMESAYLMAAAARRGIRSAVIRAVSDGADADLPLDFDRVFTGDGQVSIGRVMMQVAARPGRLPGLLRLARESRNAAESLGNFLHSYVRALGGIAAPEMAGAGTRAR